jgi:hypothetical protein
MSTDYDRDFYVWSHEQARLLRAGQFSRLDITHLAQGRQRPRIRRQVWVIATARSGESASV